jgi:hypothetical protein
MGDGMQYNSNDPDFEFKVTKYVAYIPVHEYQMYDAGLSDTPVKIPEYHPTRIDKIRWYLSLKVASIRLHIGSWIAGVDMHDHDEW